MFKFDEVKASVAIANGTNMTAIQDRAVVCRCKKNILVSNDDNRIMLEKGDIVVCTNTGDKERIRLTYESYAKTMSSKDLIWSDSDVQRTTEFYSDCLHAYAKERYPYQTACTLDEFKDSFEILDDETALVEKHINIAEEKEYELEKINNKKAEAQFEAREKVLIRNMKIIVIAFIFGVLGFIICISTNCVPLAWLTILSWVFGGVILCLTIREDAKEDYNSAFISKIMSKKSKSLIEKLEKEYSEQLDTGIAELDKLRTSDGWYKGE